MAFKVSGTERLASKLDLLDLRVKASVVSEMRDITDDLKDESQQLAPKLSGELREQAYSDVIQHGDIITGEVGYDGPRDYLLVQHEGGWINLVAWGRDYGPTKIKHYTTPGTGPKFLENPWAERLPSNKRRLHGAVRKGIGG